MKINRNNYEPYFIDYIDGILDEKLMDDFLEFLQQNPDLKNELALFQSVLLEPEDIQFNKKEKLYKNKFDLEDNFNHASVASLEGDLSDDEKLAFENYLKLHPEKKNDFLLFERTWLQPDLSVKFENKSSLYHRTVGKTVLMWSIRIAAVLILTFTFYVLTDRYSNNKIAETKVAVIQNEKPQGQPPEKVTPDEIKKQTEPAEEQDQKAGKKPAAITIRPKVTMSSQKPAKSLHENNKERIDETTVELGRTPVDALEIMPRLSASLELKQPKPTLRTMHNTIPEEPVFRDEERFIADVVKEKTGLNKLSLSKLAKAGLTFVSNISNAKLTYETDKSGKVSEISYDSRLFAFSIPTKNETEK